MLIFLIFARKFSISGRIFGRKLQSQSFSETDPLALWTTLHESLYILPTRVVQCKGIWSKEQSIRGGTSGGNRQPTFSRKDHVNTTTFDDNNKVIAH